MHSWYKDIINTGNLPYYTHLNSSAKAPFTRMIFVVFFMVIFSLTDIVKDWMSYKILSVVLCNIITIFLSNVFLRIFQSEKIAQLSKVAAKLNYSCKRVLRKGKSFNF